MIHYVLVHMFTTMSVVISTLLFGLLLPSKLSFSLPVLVTLTVA